MLMKQDLIILEEDKQWARQRIAELEKQIQDLGPEFHDVFNQSSETWHDNAPFDALRDRQSVLDAERQQLRSILRQSAVSVPKLKKGVVGIGSIVEVHDKRGKHHIYKIAGDWTPHAGKNRNHITTISRLSPLGAALYGAHLNQTLTIGKSEYVIQKID